MLKGYVIVSLWKWSAVTAEGRPPLRPKAARRPPLRPRAAHHARKKGLAMQFHIEFGFDIRKFF